MYIRMYVGLLTSCVCVSECLCVCDSVCYVSMYVCICYQLCVQCVSIVFVLTGFVEALINNFGHADGALANSDGKLFYY